MLRNLSLRWKLAITVSLIGIIVGGVNLYQIKAVERVNHVSDDLAQKSTPELNQLENIQYINSVLDEKVQDYQQQVGSAQKQMASETAISIKTDAATLQQSVQKYQALAKNDSDTEAQQNLSGLSGSASEIDLKAQQLTTKTANSDINFLHEQSLSLGRNIVALVAHEQTVVTQQKNEINQAVRSVKTLFIIMTLAVTLAAILICVILSISIARSLTRLKAGALRIANGDFSAPLAANGSDEIGQLGKAFNTMSERLRDSYRRLAVEQQRDEAILQSMGEGLIATDESGSIVLINQIATNYLNVSDAAVIGKPIQDIYEIYDQNDKDKKALSNDERPLYTAISSGETVDGVYAFYQKDGRKALLNITATPIKLESKVVGAISVMRDVTKEKEIDRMKTEFISLASHQLRTPLSAIKWFTEMLVSGDAGKLTDEQLEFAKNIDDSTERMIALVNALLNISRIESGRIMIDPKPTDLKELVSGIVNDLKAKTEERQQTLLISVHDDLPKINLDPRLIGQVYLNLLTNAVKYTPKGGEISVFISRKDNEIISQVTDNGYGIPQEQQPRLFEKFFRASNAVKVETDGTGLGLYLIKAVIESSGGKIWFKSEEGKGSTFWFSIPASGMKAKEGEVTLDV